MTKTLIKVRLQGTEDEVNMARALLLKTMPGIRMGKPREGSNPRYVDNQKWAAYGDLLIDESGKQIRRQRRKRKKAGA